MNARWAYFLLLVVFLSSCDAKQSGWLGTGIANEKIHLASSQALSVTVPTGGSNQLKFSVSIALGASLEDVALSLAGLPNGVTAVFSPSICVAASPECSVTMTVSVGETVPGGAIPITITGTGALSGKTTKLPITLIVIPTLTIKKTGTGVGSVSSDIAGIACGTYCTATYPANTKVILTATSTPDSTFSGWSEIDCLGIAPCVVTMDQAKTVTATFTLKTFSLTILFEGTGTGTVSGGGTYNYNQPAVPLAFANSNSLFDGFSGPDGAECNTGSVIMIANKTCTATFTLNIFRLTVAIVGSGSVLSDIVGINCGDDCSEDYLGGTQVLLTAEPAVNGTTSATFLGWSGASCPGMGDCLVTMDSAKSVTAKFSVLFEAERRFPAVSGTKPGTLAIADLDEDGFLDLVIGSFDPSKIVSIMIGVGDGSFETATSLLVGVGQNSVATNDVNGDGHFDVITGNEGAHTVSILLGDGNGVFDSFASLPVGKQPRAIATGDLNSDLLIDIVTANLEGTLSVVMQDSPGVFRDAISYPAGQNPHSVVIQDINADSKADIVIANFSDDTVSVLLGNGDGTFINASLSPFSVDNDTGKTASPFSVTVSDVNNDGFIDILTANKLSNAVSLLLGDGLGNFGVPRFFPVGSGPRSIAIGDLNGDSNIDIVTGNLESDNVSILFGDGAGFFSTPLNLAVGADPRGVAVRDLDRDGKLDLITANSGSGNISVFLNQ